ncbi:sensor histidine kinase [Arthrobacter sp. A2-55]|uniref:sensor histidine kinase n=1 Tax=Arthrobacter sp. A2-55 TaxID=2897337 RepID=UPI0021CDE624|nr:HAMP domain-containing sensor histidine kinase [Arthrobacter sp. A2-55]MCU6481972.1 HAMP domain-containing histidine kinase [Arthrobacter sp. A2-55]
MRVRVLGVLGVLSLLLVLGLAYSLLSAGSRELTQELQINRVASLNRLAQVASEAAASNDWTVLQTEMDSYSNLYGEGILVHTQDRALASGALDPNRTDVKDAFFNASLNLSLTSVEPLWPLGPSSKLVSRSFGSANQVLGEVVLEVDTAPAQAKLRTLWLLVIVAAVVLEAGLLLLAARVTGWVLRPIHRLNSAVLELEATGSMQQLPQDGPPELRELSRSLTTMAAAVQESLDQQRQLIADTSHQLRNPVAALRLRADLLQLQLTDGPGREGIQPVLAELDRVEGLLDGVLTLATAENRLSEGQARQAVGPSSPAGARANPALIAQEELERAGAAAALNGTTLVWGREPAGDVELDCNPLELAQMVGELLGNAIKYAAGGTVEVSVGAGPGEVHLDVSDDGPGLPAEELASAVARFWRAPQHRGIPGTGLGMTIVDRLARANGGELVLAAVHPHGLRARLVFRR